MMVYDVNDDAIVEPRSTIARLIAQLRHAYNCVYIWLTDLCYAAARFL